MATKDFTTNDPMIDPHTGEFRVIAPGQTFKSVTAKISDIVLTPHTPWGWYGLFVVAGSVTGIAGALLLSRLMTKLLYGVQPTDPTTFVIVAAGLGVVAMVACYIPARRAMRIDPMSALRYE